MNIGFSTVVLATLSPLILIAVVLVGAARRGRRLVFDDVAYPGLAHLRRATLGARRVGLLLSFAAYLLLVQAPWWLPALAPVVAGAIMVGAIMVGQRMAYRSAQSAGVASVEHRSVADYLPRVEPVVGAIVAALLAVASVVAGVSAAADDSGERRFFSFQCIDTVHTPGGAESQVIQGWTDQFPGGYYLIPLWVGLVLLAGLAVVALTVIVRRPRNGADPELVRVDDALRRQSAEGVVGSVCLAVAASLVWLLYRAGVAVGTGDCDPMLGATAFGLGITALVALLPTCWFAIRVLVPGDGTKSAEALR